MQGIFANIPASHWLIIRKDNGVVLGVRLMAALTAPVGITSVRWSKAPVRGEHKQDTEKSKQDKAVG